MKFKEERDLFMSNKKPVKIPEFRHVIDMDDVVRMVFTQFPKMKLYGETTRIAYIPCRSTPMTDVEKQKVMCK